MVMSVLRIHASVLRMLVFVGIVKTVAFESAIVIAIIGQGITANAIATGGTGEWPPPQMSRGRTSLEIASGIEPFSRSFVSQNK